MTRDVDSGILDSGFPLCPVACPERALRIEWVFFVVKGFWRFRLIASYTWEGRRTIYVETSNRLSNSAK
jgi:hypothetical protein